MRKSTSTFTGLILAALVVLGAMAYHQGWLPGLASRQNTHRGGTEDSHEHHGHDHGHAADLCAHQLPPGKCPFCDEALIEAMGFCHGHGVPEAFCTKCNPWVIPGFKAVNDWCAGHEIPESQCTICNPELLDAPEPDKQQSATSPLLELLDGPAVPRSQRTPAITCNTSSLQVQFLSPETASIAGLEYARVERREITQSISCNLEMTYDGNRYARLATRSPGTVSAVRKDLGEAVQAGEVLALVDSAGLGTARSEYLQAQTLVNLWEKNHAIELRLLEKRAGTERDMLQAETKLTKSRIALAGAQQRLRNLGISDDQISKFSKGHANSSLLPLTAPFPGVVVERNAVVGEVVDTKASLLSIADTSKMWAMLEVYESDVPKVRIGQPVVLEVEGIPGERRGGTVTWVSSHVDHRTRTLKVRTEVDNADGLLRSGMYGKAVISIRDKEPTLVVPKDAVQWEGCCNVVFTRQSDMLFTPKKVRIGYDTDRFYVVEEGLEENDEIVTTGSFLLKTEIMKGSIGAGCCEAGLGRQES